MASKALISGVSLQEVCDAAGWHSPLTFVCFYSLDLDTTLLSSCLSCATVSQGQALVSMVFGHFAPKASLIQRKFPVTIVP